MDAFTTVLILWVATLVGAYGLGTYMSDPNFAEGCNKNGEYIVRNVVFKCEPVFAVVNGKRVKLQE